MRAAPESRSPRLQHPCQYLHSDLRLRVSARIALSMAESILLVNEPRNSRYALTRLVMDCLTAELPAEFAASLSTMTTRSISALSRLSLSWMASCTTAGPYVLTAFCACVQAGSEDALIEVRATGEAGAAGEADAVGELATLAGAAGTSGLQPDVPPATTAAQASPAAERRSPERTQAGIMAAPGGS